MFLQRKVWWCHHFVELLWNSQLLAMILSREKNGFGFGEFFFATFGGFLQTIHQESKEYFGGFFWLWCFDCPSWKPLGTGKTTEGGSPTAVMKFSLNWKLSVAVENSPGWKFTFLWKTCLEQNISQGFLHDRLPRDEVTWSLKIQNAGNLLLQLDVMGSSLFPELP